MDKLKEDLAEDLIEAVRHDNLEQVINLIGLGADILKKNNYGWTALHLASNCGYLEIVKVLLKSYVDINAESSISEQSDQGQTALYVALAKGNFEIVKLLVSYGANVSEKNNCGCTALHLASYMGYFDIVKYLVESYADDAGAYIDVLSNRGQTAIDVAKTEDIKKFLMEQVGGIQK